MFPSRDGTVKDSQLPLLLLLVLCFASLLSLGAAKTYAEFKNNGEVWTSKYLPDGYVETGGTYDGKEGTYYVIEPERHKQKRRSSRPQPQQQHRAVRRVSNKAPAKSSGASKDVLDSLFRSAPHALGVLNSIGKRDPKGVVMNAAMFWNNGGRTVVGNAVPAIGARKQNGKNPRK